MLVILIFMVAWGAAFYFLCGQLALGVYVFGVFVFGLVGWFAFSDIEDGR